MKRHDVLLLTSLSLLGAFVAIEALATRDDHARREASFGMTRLTSAGPVAGTAKRDDERASEADVGASRQLDEVRRRLERSGHGTYIGEVIAARDSAITRWPDRAADPLRVWVQPASSIRGFNADFVPLVWDAFTDWTDSGVPLAFSFIRDSAAADIRVTWVDHFAEPISGKTLWAFDGQWWIVDAQIQIALHQVSGVALDSASIQAIARHEVGHLIGLDHTRDTTSIMLPRVRVRELSPSDRATARLLYRLPPGRIGHGPSQTR